MTNPPLPDNDLKMKPVVICHGHDGDSDIRRGSDPKISAQKQGVAVEVEVDVGSQVVFPLSLGI